MTAPKTDIHATITAQIIEAIDAGLYRPSENLLMLQRRR